MASVHPATREPNAQWSSAHTGADELDGRYDSLECPSPRSSVRCASSVPTSTRSTSWLSVSIRKSTPWTSRSTADSMRSVASSPRFYISSAVDIRTSGFDVTRGSLSATFSQTEVVNRVRSDGLALRGPSIRPDSYRPVATLDERESPLDVRIAYASSEVARKASPRPSRRMRREVTSPGSGKRRRTRWVCFSG